MKFKSITLNTEGRKCWIATGAVARPTAPTAAVQTMASPVTVSLLAARSRRRVGAVACHVCGGCTQPSSSRGQALGSVAAQLLESYTETGGTNSSDEQNLPTAASVERLASELMSVRARLAPPHAACRCCAAMECHPEF